MIPATGKFEYRDTHFVANVKALSALDCYNRIVEYLRQRVDPVASSRRQRVRILHTVIWVCGNKVM